MLFGRGVQQRRIVDLLARARDGTSGTLVLVGEPGIGKTALLDYAVAEADAFEIARARGVESEAELPFAALFELCRPFLDRLDRLEPQQVAALRVTFGLAVCFGRDGIGPARCPRPGRSSIRSRGAAT